MGSDWVSCVWHFTPEYPLSTYCEPVEPRAAVGQRVDEREYQAHAL